VNALLRAIVYMFLHTLLNVLVQITNKMELQKIADYVLSAEMEWGQFMLAPSTQTTTRSIVRPYLH
jgi:hypothetical protein